MAVIGLDATSVSLYGKGLSRYQYNLIHSLAKLDKNNCYYIFLNKKNSVPPLPVQDNFHYVKIYMPIRIIWDQFQLPVIMRKYHLDIYHACFETLPLAAGNKLIIYLFEIPDYRINSVSRSSDSSLYAWVSQSYTLSFFRPSIRKARLVITSSHSTKKDLIQKYSLDEKKIRVVYPGCDDSFSPSINSEKLQETRKKYNSDEGYIFHISSSDPRDNTPVVLRAYKNALAELKIPVKLIIFGDIRGTGIEALAKGLQLEGRVIFTGRLSQEELLELYQAASLYIDPSLYEGFGYQVLEAMSCGIPVITSNVTSLPEVSGSAGIIMDPNDIDGFRGAITKVINDPGLRQSMSRKSLERAKFFSKDKEAGEILSIYDELVLS
ncbi:MAG: glycosyltransferase family 1 protein [Candidatus Omnitrophota bacterium]|nr:glycosyltransferase family 1 protein [Candidatus Omnitrophota bacterium]